jgi:hypothetical protein
MPVRLRSEFLSCLPKALRDLRFWAAASLAFATVSCDREEKNSAGISAEPSTVAVVELSSEDREFFENHIRPLLAENCYECHSESAGKQKGGLWLDRRAGWVEGGDSGPAIVAHQPEQSLLISAIHRNTGSVEAMPPDYRLSDAEIETLENWIARGAPDPRLEAPAKSKAEGIDVAARKTEHWCWRPLPPTGSAPPLPQVSEQIWIRQPIDAFVLAALEEKGLRPAAEVAPQAWLRRVSYDLTGLPPTLAELDAFLADSPDENARQRAVDHLLASRAFGEHWARHWMDLVRYAESYGHEFDFDIPHAYEYRDYLIRAFNADLPYDQLLREHLAGDLLPEPRIDPDTGCNESVLGTAFWFFHEAAHAPTEPRGDQADHMANQIDVFGKTFLGLTLGCARCHDHKFDAVTTRDYYALSAHLLGSTRQQYPLDPHGRIASEADELKALREKLDTAFKKSSPPSSAPRPGLIFRQIGDEIGKAQAAYNGKNPWPEAPTQRLLSPDEAADEWRVEPGTNDALVSKPFVIEHWFLNFLVDLSNGSSEQPCAIELLLGDSNSPAIATQLSNSPIPPSQSWDLRKFVGESARVRLRAPGIGETLRQTADTSGLVVAPENSEPSAAPVRLTFSHAVQADAPCRIPAPPGSPHLRLFEKLASVPPPTPPIDPLRGEAAVAETLGAITGELSDCESVEAFLATLLASPERIEKVRKRHRDYQNAEKEFYQKSKPMNDFSGTDLPDYWHRGGEAFLLTGDRPLASLDETYWFAPAGMIESGLLGPSMEGSLRSPIFEIPTNNIHMRLRSSGPATRARLVIDDYQLSLDFGLLFEGTYLKTDKLDTGGASKWKSFSIDLYKYVGHRAWIEFIDEGDGQIAVDEIRFANRLAPSGKVHPVVAALLDAMPDEVNSELASAALDRLWKNATDRLAADRLENIDVELLNWLHSSGWITDSQFGTSVTEARQLATEINLTLPRPRYAPAIAAAAPEAARVHIRGNHDNPGAAVPARGLEALGSRAGDRLQLANDLVADDNPLTARVIANRLWHHLFGRGIVASVDDFGPMGTAPSHPALLDWLARDLADHDWSLKRSLRQIVLSSTYRQSTQPHPDLDQEHAARLDSDNILLHHYPRRRLSAEAIRDSLLAVSGDLIRDDAGGPGAPVHLTSFMTNRDIDHNGPLDGDRRRTVYGQVKRNYLPPFLLNFDFPRPLGTMGARRVSNVPAQALTLLNDPFVHQQAERWATRELAENANASERDRLRRMFRSAIGRLPETDEENALLGFLQRGESTPQQRWTDLAHALVNLKEFIYLE